MNLDTPVVMGRLAAFAIACWLAACASRPVPATTAFDSHPSYPVTVVPLSPFLSLRHVAGKPCGENPDARPPVGSDGTRTFSVYELLGAGGTKLFSAPSMLSDPKLEMPEFRDYYRVNDQLKVLTSGTGNTILIIEDRSPAYPHRAHILLRKAADGSWAWSQLEVPTFPRVGPPTDKSFAEVVGLSDSAVWFGADKRTWSQPLK